MVLILDNILESIKERLKIENEKEKREREIVESFISQESICCVPLISLEGLSYIEIIFKRYPMKTVPDINTFNSYTVGGNEELLKDSSRAYTVIHKYFRKSLLRGFPKIFFLKERNEIKEGLFSLPIALLSIVKNGKVFMAIGDIDDKGNIKPIEKNKFINILSLIEQNPPEERNMLYICR